MAKSRANTGDPENRNSSDSAEAPVPILGTETEQFPQRLKEAIGDESLKSFAGRAQFSDRLLGDYVRGVKEPGLQKLAAIAKAADCSLDYLVLGRPLQSLTRFSQAPGRVNRATQPYPEWGSWGGEKANEDQTPYVVAPAAPEINAAALASILGGVLKAMGENPDYDKAARKAVEFYQEAVREGMITSKGVGEGGEKSA